MENHQGQLLFLQKITCATQKPIPLSSAEGYKDS
jgi:hypothetical protein